MFQKPPVNECNLQSWSDRRTDTDRQQLRLHSEGGATGTLLRIAEALTLDLLQEGLWEQK